ncbi:MAG TPA: Gfo/Idh/MocA family oxidoreductase [Chloroflexia bacterium]|nr:Gfo/Idh/MocA family oxidoreductase [Chloroflexia bacterium]
MQGTQLRWGVLGTARIADKVVHGMKLAENSVLVAIASRDLNTAQAWAEARGVPHAFGRYEEMLASDVIDAVYIPLPNGLHKGWSVKALESGKHVLCEKPLANNADQVREIIAASEATGLKAMEATMYRFHPAVARMQQLLAEGVIGEVKVIRATFGFRLERPNDVRWSPDLGGGALLDVGSYCVNNARLVAGSEPLGVVACQVLSAGGVDIETVGVLEFPEGVLAAIDCSFETGPGAHQGLTISGTKGRMFIAQPFSREEEPLQIVIDGGGAKHTVEVPGADHYHMMVEHFADAVLHDHPLAYTLQNSLGNMRVLDALKEAARSGRRVEL